MGASQFSFISRCGTANLRTLAGGIWNKLLIISGSRLLIRILITAWDINHLFSHDFEVLRDIGRMSTGYPRTYQCWAENCFITFMNTIRWYLHPTNIPIDDEIMIPLNFWWSADSDLSKWGSDISPITGRGTSNPKIWPWKIQDDPYLNFRLWFPVKMPAENPNIAAQPIQTVDEWRWNLGNVTILRLFLPDQNVWQMNRCPFERKKNGSLESSWIPTLNQRALTTICPCRRGIFTKQWTRCFNSRTHEKADFILNHVYLIVRTARYSYLFSLHVLDILTGVKTLNDFIHCITLGLYEFISFNATRLDFSLTFCAISLEAEF
jgi:hypothetical protein